MLDFERPSGFGYDESELGPLQIDPFASSSPKDKLGKIISFAVFTCENMNIGE